MKPLHLMLVFLLLTGLAAAKDRRVYDLGTLMKMNAVNCGYDQNDGKTFAGMMLGTGGEKRHMRQALCQEYVLDSARITYRIRPKDEKHPELLPVGDNVQFRIHKDKLLLRNPEISDKEREYIVVSMEPRSDVPAPAAQPLGTEHKQALPVVTTAK
jgi:hypothetical protein